MLGLVSRQTVIQMYVRFRIRNICRRTLLDCPCDDLKVLDYSQDFTARIFQTAGSLVDPLLCRLGKVRVIRGSLSGTRERRPDVTQALGRSTRLSCGSVRNAGEGLRMLGSEIRSGRGPGEPYFRQCECRSDLDQRSHYLATDNATGIFCLVDHETTVRPSVRQMPDILLK